MSLAHRISHLPFHTKVLIPVLAILIAMPIVTVGLVNQHVRQRSLLSAEEKLSAAEAVLKNSLQIRARSQEVQFRNAVNEPRFKAVSQLNDADTMRAYLRDSLNEFGPEVAALLYTPADGSPSSSVRRSKDIDLARLETSLLPNIETALQGDIDATLSVYSGSAYNTVSLPVYLSNAGYPTGALTIALGLGDQAIAELKSLNNTEILLVAEGQAVGSTLPADKAVEALAANVQTAAGTIRSIELFGEHFHALSNRLASGTGPSQAFSYVLLSSYESEMQALRRTRLLLVAISLGGIVISAFIIYFLIRRITSPLRLLKSGADAVGRGNLSHHVECRSNDECGDLATAFNHMTGNLLSSRRDLENTVRELRQTQEQLIEREQRLRESEEGLRLIIEGARDHAIFTLDLDGKILRWNAASERIFGYTTQEAQGRLRYIDLFEDASASAAAAQALVDRAQASAEASTQGWRRRQDGSLFWADITLSKLETGGYVEITRDITARKEAETAVLQARDAAEASDRAKSEFLANMSHEFRTPMNGIIGMASLLSSMDLTDEQNDYTDTIRLSADKLLAIIDDILDIAKIEADELEVAVGAINLMETIEDSLSLFQAKCEERALGLHLVVSNQVPACIATDPNRLRQVLCNIVDNALKFTPEGGVIVSMDYEPNEERLCIDVKDTGIGIEPEKQSSLFDPFFQVESSASREFGGTGLGLTISRSVVKLLGGDISVQSQLGQGSTFRITLDAKSLDIDPPFEQFPEHRALLLVDDPVAREALSAQLSHWEITLSCLGSNPGRLPSALAETAYELLIVDHSATRPDTIRSILAAKAKKAETFPPIIRLVSGQEEGELTHGSRCVPLSRPLSLRAFNRQIAAFKKNPQPPQNIDFSRRQEADAKAVPKTAAETPAAASGSGTLADEHPLRILIVEDNPINTKVLQKMLKKLGYEAETAENGAEGLAAAESMRFDLVLMDLQMPVMDGLESSRRILSSESIEHPIYISAFTANAREEDRAACQELGMHDFVAKPARLPAVKAVIERALAWLAQHANLVD